jgi:hypothetical protein
MTLARLLLLLPRRLSKLILALGVALAASAAAAAGPVLAGATGSTWNELTPAQREVLKPLQRDWNNIDDPRKKKWLEVAARYPKLSPDEQKRVQERMGDWARMSPSQRGQARQNYQEAKQQAGREERRARWEAYQALPEEERRALASRAADKRAPNDARRKNRAAETDQAKSNIVTNPLYSAQRPKAVAPTVVQASPGATTNLMSKRPNPPAHQQTGLPKIAATPEFVDSNTLLPQRGPQGAAIEPVRPQRGNR